MIEDIYRDLKIDINLDSEGELLRCLPEFIDELYPLPCNIVYRDKKVIKEEQVLNIIKRYNQTSLRSNGYNKYFRISKGGLFPIGGELLGMPFLTVYEGDRWGFKNLFMSFINYKFGLRSSSLCVLLHNPLREEIIKGGIFNWTFLFEGKGEHFLRLIINFNMKNDE